MQSPPRGSTWPARSTGSRPGRGGPASSSSAESATARTGSSWLIERLLGHEVARVAIEQPNGRVVDRLLDAGIAVVAVHPNQFAAAR